MADALEGMTGLRVELDPEKAGIPEMAGKQVREGRIAVVSGLSNGTSGGKPSAALIIELADGTVVFAETTMSLFLTAATALKARFGEEAGHGDG